MFNTERISDKKLLAADVTGRNKLLASFSSTD